MKNRLLTLAGALALAAVLGKFYAVPALAQVARAALVQDRDSMARNYYQTYNLNCGYAPGICITDLPVVPAGKRLIITHINGETLTISQTALWRMSLWIKNQSQQAIVDFGLPHATPSSTYVCDFNQSVYVAFDAGQTPQFMGQVNDNSNFAWTATITGFMVDLP